VCPYVDKYVRDYVTNKRDPLCYLVAVKISELNPTKHIGFDLVNASEEEISTLANYTYLHSIFGNFSRVDILEGL
jgi:hypothetical protein